jgi:hypothetical protein
MVLPKVKHCDILGAMFDLHSTLPGRRRRTPSFLWGIVLAFWVALAPSIAAAQPEDPPVPPPAESGAPDSEIPDRPLMDAAHYRISNSLLSTAEWLDAFFDDERFDSEVNESRLKISFDSSVINGEGVDFDANTHLKVVLPELENRLSFEISGDTGDRIRDDRPRDRVPGKNIDDESDSGGLAAGFRYLLAAKEQFNIHIKSGARIRGLEPVLYIGPRYRQTWALENWDLRFTQRFRWYSDDGWESRSRWDLERPVFGDYFFRTTTEIEWSEVENGLFYDLDFSLSHAIDGRSAIEFQWNNRFRTRPHDQLSTTVFRLRYRRRVWRDWLSFEVAPQIAYPRDRDYNFTPGILFRFQVVFGFYSRTGYY